MDTLEIARRCMALGDAAGAVTAYKLALNEYGGRDAAAEFEAALHILQFGGGDDYKISFSAFINLYNQGFAQPEIIDIMDEAFYQPNIQKQQKRYAQNCRLLAKYPYIFRQDFPAFAELPVKFYPYDDDRYVPYVVAERRFGEFFAPKDQVISRNFFADLAQPVLAAEVFSQYELEYLVDNVRKSEYVARENHIYLHYADWPVFCAYLQCLDLQPLLAEKKIVFLFADELEQYPIDFQQRFGIDYSQYPVKRVGIREISRLIWHTQLSAHNGGDFFNEIFDAHPNLLAKPSHIFDSVEEIVADFRQIMNKSRSLDEACRHIAWPRRLVKELYELPNRTDKDIFAAIYLGDQQTASPHLDKQSRIAPAIFFQPHFSNIFYKLHVNAKGKTVLASEQYDAVRQSPFIRGFKYIKTFTPMRRITTSHGATVKFKCNDMQETEYVGDKRYAHMDDAVLNRVLNRSFMIDWQDRLFKDSRLVRFEDGKLNPRATFRALAAFLDLPYTESMTYCSLQGERDPESLAGNDIGFSTAALYRTYDEYTNDAERAFIEYFMRDAYEYYGYDFHYYDGQPVDENLVKNWLANFDIIDNLMLASLREVFSVENGVKIRMQTATRDEYLPMEEYLPAYMEEINANRLSAAKILMSGLRFVNKNGQPLHMMPKLELDPALLEQPLYH